MRLSLEVQEGLGNYIQNDNSGGGNVKLTYYKGFEEAKRFKKEFQKLSKNNSIFELNILNQEHLNKLKKVKKINCVFYCNTKILKSWNKNIQSF